MAADLIFTGGRIYTVLPDGRRMVPATAGGEAASSEDTSSGAGIGIADGPPATAVAVRGGRIVAVGTDDEIRDLAGSQAETVPLGGRPLLPGFQDAHVHPAFAGITMLRCDLDGAGDLAGALDRIRAYAAAQPDREWVDGSGWRMEWFPGGTPSRELLDSVVPDRPAYLTNRDGHGAWVNSRALELAGLTAATPDPADGRIERGADGEPQGTLHEGAALLVGRLVPGPTLRRAGSAGCCWPSSTCTRWASPPGRTRSWGSTSASRTRCRPTWPPRRTARSPPGWPGALWWDRARGGDQLDDLLDRRQAGQAGRFRAGTVKIMQDGVAENFTAGMIDPYLDACGCQTGNRGLSYVDPADLAEQVTRLDAAGFGVHVHAIGDRAVREALDAVRGRPGGQRGQPGPAPHRPPPGAAPRRHPALRATQRDREHAGAVGRARAADGRPDDPVPRAGAGRPAVPVRRPAAGRRPAGGGQRLGGEQRQPAGGDPRRGEPDRCRPRPGSRRRNRCCPARRSRWRRRMAAYTAGSAYVNHLDETGAIEPGYLADLVILDRDPFAGPPAEIAAATVALTYVEGERVYAAPTA